jgi:hypothetical protein
VSRTTVVVVVLAALVGLALAGGVVLISNTNDSSQAPQAGRSLTSERAPEAENHSVGDLPAVEAAARGFLASYLPVVYGKPGATINDLHSASPRLVEELRNEGGHATPAQTQRTPHVQRVTAIREGQIGALATAQIKDSPSPAYPLVFHLQDSPDGWVVTRIGGP